MELGISATLYSGFQIFEYIEDMHFPFSLLSGSFGKKGKLKLLLTLISIYNLLLTVFAKIEVLLTC